MKVATLQKEFHLQKQLFSLKQATNAMMEPLNAQIKIDVNK